MSSVGQLEFAVIVSRYSFLTVCCFAASDGLNKPMTAMSLLNVAWQDSYQDILTGSSTEVFLIQNFLR